MNKLLTSSYSTITLHKTLNVQGINCPRNFDKIEMAFSESTTRKLNLFNFEIHYIPVKSVDVGQSLSQKCHHDIGI